MEWIKNYPNALYTKHPIFFEKFVRIFNKGTDHEKKLNCLKREIEKKYNTTLQEFKEPLKFPLFKDGKCGNIYYDNLNCNKQIPNEKKSEILIESKKENKNITQVEHNNNKKKKVNY